MACCGEEVKIKSRREENIIRAEFESTEPVWSNKI